MVSKGYPTTTILIPSEHPAVKSLVSITAEKSIVPISKGILAKKTKQGIEEEKGKGENSFKKEPHRYFDRMSDSSVAETSLSGKDVYASSVLLIQETPFSLSQFSLDQTGNANLSVLDNYNYDFHNLQNEISDVTLYSNSASLTYSEQNTIEDDFLSLLTTYYDLTPDRIISVLGYFFS